MATNFTISAYTENSPGVLLRITGLFTRRKLNIESLTVSETERHALSRFTIVVKAERDVADKVARQIRRIVEVREVQLCSDDELVSTEVAFIKVEPVAEREREEFHSLVSSLGARVSFENDHGVIVEKTGEEHETAAAMRALSRYRIKEFIRSGRIAMLKAPRAEAEQQAYQQSAERVGAEEWI